MVKIDNNFKLFKEIGIPKDIINHYSEVKLENEQFALLKGICLEIMSKEKNLYFEIREIFKREFQLKGQAKIVLLQFVNTKTSLLRLLINSKINNDYYDFDIIESIVLTLSKQRNIDLTKDVVHKLCNVIYNIPFNTLEVYKNLAKVIIAKTNLSDDILREYKSKPSLPIIHLVIYLLQSDEKIKTYISEIDFTNVVNVIFTVRDCLIIKDNEQKFIIDIINNELTRVIVPKLDRADLLNQYILLLFELLLVNDKTTLVEEIKRIISFQNWNPEGLILQIHRVEKEVSPSFVECVYLVADKIGSNKQGNTDYILDGFFSKLPSTEFNKYYLSILSLLQEDVGVNIVERIQNDIPAYLDGLIEASIVFNKKYFTALKVLKKLFKEKTLNVKSVDETYYLHLLRSFHCYELDAFFVCDIAIDFYLNTSTKTIKKDIYDYIISSISENYFMTLEEIVLNVDNNELATLKDYIKNKSEIIEFGLNNPDFKPSIKNMNRYYEKKADFNRKIQEKAREKSIFKDIIQNQTILYGNKVKYTHKDAGGNVHTQESEMKKIEHSMAIPVRFVNDPLFHKLEIDKLKEGFQDD